MSLKLERKSQGILLQLSRVRMAVKLVETLRRLNIHR